jgi:uncharacterized protein YecT (DUF1311 family)
MIVLRLLLIALLLGAAPQSAVAQSAEDCGRQGGTTPEIAACFRRIYDKADAEMNALYGRLRDSLADAGERTMLQAAQRAWEDYRDKECEFETAGTRLGTIHPIVVMDCLTEKTAAHTTELQRQLDCGDGDTGCLHERRQ